MFGKTKFVMNEDEERKKILRSPYFLRDKLRQLKGTLAEPKEETSPDLSETLQEDLPTNSLRYLQEEPSSTYSTPIPKKILKKEEMAAKVTVLQGQEVAKFRGNRTSKDAVFATGPSISEFLENLQAYFRRHEITSDVDKICTLRLLIDPSVGDARFVVNNLLDSKINTKAISFAQLCELLKENYREQESLSLYDAALHLQSTISRRVDTPQMQLVEITKSIQNFVDAITSRSQFGDNSKSIEESMKEGFLLYATALWGGRTLTEKVLQPFPANKEPRDLSLALLKNLKKEGIKKEDTETVAATAPVDTAAPPMIPSKTSAGLGRRQPPPHRQTRGGKQEQNIKAKFIYKCYRCGLKSHKIKDCKVPAENIICSLCNSRTHVASVCQSQSFFRESGGQSNSRYRP